MPNPNPVQSEEFLQKRFQPAPDIPPTVQLAKKPRCVKLPEAVDDAISNIPSKERSAWLRQAVYTEAVRQGLVSSDCEEVSQQETRSYVVYLSLDWCQVHTEVIAPVGASQDQLHDLAISELTQQILNSKLRKIADS